MEDSIAGLKMDSLFQVFDCPGDISGFRFQRTEFVEEADVFRRFAQGLAVEAMCLFQVSLFPGMTGTL